jgi:hypothetical protein
MDEVKSVSVTTQLLCSVVIDPDFTNDITGIYSQNCHSDWAEREIFTVRSGGTKSPPQYFSGLTFKNRASYI